MEKPLTMISVGRGAVNKSVIRIGRHLVLPQSHLIRLQAFPQEIDDFLYFFQTSIPFLFGGLSSSDQWALVLLSVSLDDIGLAEEI